MEIFLTFVRATLIVVFGFIVVGMAFASGHSAVNSENAQQEAIPQMPENRDGVYVAVTNGELFAIPFETARTPLKPTEVAKGNKTSYIEVPGEHSQTTVHNLDPRIYLFVSDVPNTHPPFLIRFTVKKGARRVTAVTESGLSGYAISSEQIVKPSYRVLTSRDGKLFMEIRARGPLIPGEYAIMGSDLSHVATFSVGL